MITSNEKTDKTSAKMPTKAKRPTKKGLIGEIETLDKEKRFNLLSLTRTNIENLITIRDLLLRG